MKLGSKISITLTSSVLLLSGVSTLSAYIGFKKAINTIEQQEANDSSERLKAALQIELSSLSSKAKDWSNWDDLHSYALGKNNSFWEIEAGVTALENLKVNFLHVLDTTCNIKNSVGISLTEPTKAASPPILVSFLKQQCNGESFQKMVSVDDQFYLVAGHPILNSSGSGSIAGTLVFSRLVDIDILMSIKRSTGHDLSIARANVDSIENVLIKTLDNNSINIQAIKRVADLPLQLTYNVSRPAFRAGQEFIQTQFFALTFCLIIGIFIILYLINRLFVSRITRLTAELADIDQSGDKKAKLTVDDGKDEISELSTQYNLIKDSQLKAESAAEEQRALAIHASRLSSIGEMATGMAHEINNPLAVMLGHAQALNKKTIQLPTDIRPAFESSLSTIIKMGERIAGLIETVRKMSSSNTATLRTETKLLEILNQALHLQKEKIKDHNIHCQIECSEDLLLRCDPIKIQQAINNLIENSIEAISSQEKKWIKIKAEINLNQRLAIRVADSGTGINADVSQKMMNPFFTTKPIGSGAGIGLSVGRAIIKDHGGTLTYEIFEGHTSFLILI
jgi:signal transduction histidine kinase